MTPHIMLSKYRKTKFKKVKSNISSVKIKNSNPFVSHHFIVYLKCKKKKTKVK